MGKTLVVAEKPSVARDLVAALGGHFQKADAYYESDDYVVTNAIGHLVRLADPEEYSEDLKKWRLEDLPIVPDQFQLKAYDETRTQLAAIYRLLQRDDVAQVVNACDAGREGELIFAYVYDIAQGSKPVSRLWISSMTKEAIQKGFAELKDGPSMKPLEDAARSRSEADWLVGMNATRAATLRGRGLFDGVVSLGRVQTPTLAMIVKRELEIEAFKSQGYFVIKAQFQAPGKGGYGGHWFKGDERKLTDQAQADAIALKVQGQTGVVAEVEKTESQERSPLLYDLTSLQRDANSRYGFSADETLKLTQSLYETRKAVTYPRTDSRYLPSDMKPLLKRTARTLEGLGYDVAVQQVAALADIPARIVDDKKVSDHHAIIPTLAKHEPAQWSEDERKIFDLVARRFLSVFHPPARHEHTRVTTEVAGETFRSTAKLTVEAGWRAVYAGQDIDEEPADKDEAEELGELPELVAGDRADCSEALVEKKETKPPRRYSEASLLAAMETAGKQVEEDELREAMKEGGLGTPATRAATIERLIHVGYVERKGKRQLKATTKGVQVIQMLDGHPLTSPELTGQWEKQLEDIRKGAVQRAEFMDQIKRFTGETVGLIASMDNEIVGPPISQEPIAACPTCGQPVKETPRAFSCSSYVSPEQPGCGFVIWKDVAQKRLRPETAKELIESGRTAEPLQGLVSKSGHPFAAYLVLKDGKVEFEFPEQEAVAADAAESLGACPRCGLGVIATARAYSCSSYKSPEDKGCGFVVWKETSKRPISEAELRLLLQEGRTPVLEGFKSKANKPFAAALVLKPGDSGPIEAVFDFPARVEVAADAAGTLGPCPKCSLGVVETARAYSCSSWKSKDEPGCGFVIWKEVAKRKISRAEAEALIQSGRTDVLHGFKSKSGAKFSAHLVLEPDPEKAGALRAGFEFPADSTVQADSGGAVGKCPKCGLGVVEKAKSYSCSSWKSKDEPGCGFAVWKETFGKKIGVSVVKQLLKEGRTPVLEGFKSKSGAAFAAALVLGPEGKIQPEFPDQRVEDIGPCPKCGQPVKETGRSYSCSSYKGTEDKGCGFVVWKEMAQRPITVPEVQDLLAHRRTVKLLEGFVGKSGKEFSAHLLWDADEDKVVFDFPTPSELKGPEPLTTAGGIVSTAAPQGVIGSGFSVAAAVEGAAASADDSNGTDPNGTDPSSADPSEPAFVGGEESSPYEESPFAVDE